MTIDTIVVADPVLTVDKKFDRAEAFAITNGRVSAVGSERDVLSLGDDRTEIHRFTDKTVLPSFIDPHCHMLFAGRWEHLQVNLTPEATDSFDSIAKSLTQESQETEEGDWVLGFGYDDTKLCEGDHPTRELLDEASTDHPIFITHSSGHIAVVNTKALEVAGIDEGTLDPDGGHFEREQDGFPNGILREKAMNPFVGDYYTGGLIPAPSIEDDRAALRYACNRYNSVGITSVADALIGPEEIRTYREGSKRDDLTVRSYLMVYYDYFEQLNELNLDTGFGDEMVRIGSIKNIIDGAIASRTAYLNEPYDGREDRGDLVLSQDEITEQVVKANREGYQVGYHANGDAAIEMLLNAYERALEEHPRTDHRHRIEHCTVVNDELLDRIEALDLCVTPFSTYIYQHGEKMSAYGDRLDRMFPYGSCVDRGITVGGSSDNPAGLLDPLLGIRTMVTRKTADGNVIGPDEAIGVEDAIRVYTCDAAYTCFEDDVKGSIEPDKLADFVVLSDDPTAVDPDEIHEIEVDRTFLAGEQVFPSP